MFTLIIEDTICYPENTVEIYNRGVLVLKLQDIIMSNAFNGISRGRTTVSQSSGLPTGTYFYILNYTSVDGTGQIQTNTRRISIPNKIMKNLLGFYNPGLITNFMDTPIFEY
jgi:hypothetical protein